MNDLEIQVLASSSEGNAYLIGDGVTQILIECGIPWNEIQKKTDFILPDACIVSHSHGDHAKSVKDLIRLGIPCHMSKATMGEIGGDLPDWLEPMEHRKIFGIGSFLVNPLQMEHDVPCLGFYIYSQASKESLFFATDTCCIPYTFKGGLDYIMVEANYDIDILNDRIMNGYLDPVMKNRLVKSHMEIGQTILWLRQQNLDRTKRIYLLHLSNGSANAAEFKNRVMECTGVPTTIA